MSDIAKTIGRTMGDDEGVRRDAIHVAVIPVHASKEFHPGARVGIRNGKAVESEVPLGIIDPFMERPAFEGERCWVFLLPGTVTSIRHDWNHPLIPHENEFVVSDDVAKSKSWLEDYALQNSPYDETRELAYERLVKGLMEGEVFYHGTGLHYFGDLESPEDLKYHAERVLGIRIDWTKFSFSCSC